MPLLHTEAIVLRRRRLRDADAIVIFYTRESGRIAASAKSAFKTTSRSAGVTQPFNQLQTILYAKNRDQDVWTLTQVSLVKSYTQIQTRLDRLAYGSCLAEWIDFLSGDVESNAAVWNLLIDALMRWDANEPTPKDLIFYQWRLLRLSGLQPDISTRSEAPRWVYHAADGRIAPAEGYEGAVSLNLGSIRALQQIASSSEPPRLKISQQQQGEIQRLIQAHIEYHLGRRPRSSLFIEQLAQSRMASQTHSAHEESA